MYLPIWLALIAVHMNYRIRPTLSKVRTITMNDIAYTICGVGVPLLFGICYCIIHFSFEKR